MRILVKGNPAWKYRYRRFKCERCGCVFEADKSEYDTETIVYEDFHLGRQVTELGCCCKCPNCGLECDDGEPVET